MCETLIAPGTFYQPLQLDQGVHLDAQSE